MNILLEYDDKTYTLEYNKSTVRTMEAQGFSLDKISEQPLTQIPMLFRGAFAMHHTGVKRKITDDIFESVGNKNELISALAEMYGEVVASVIGDADSESAKKVSWTKID